VTDITAQVNQLEGELARRSAVFRVETQPVEITAVQAQLPSDGVLIEYVRYRPVDAPTAFHRSVLTILATRSICCSLMAALRQWIWAMPLILMRR
jgi:hypothetical protein